MFHVSYLTGSRANGSVYAQQIMPKKSKKIVQFCGVAKRPLSIDEIREALTVKPGQKSLDRENLSNKGQIVVDCGLAFVGIEATVHFTHDRICRRHILSLFQTSRFQ